MIDFKTVLDFSHTDFINSASSPQKQVKYANLEDGPLIKEADANSESLNMKAARADGTFIVCRDISYRVALTGIKNYQPMLSSIEALKKNFSDNEYDNQDISIHSTYYNVCNFDNVGAQLGLIAEQLQKNESFSMLLASENHLMAVTIRHKHKYTQDYYVVKFYDPNKTTTHKRIIIRGVEDIQKLTMDNFMTKNEADYYFPSHKSILLFSLKQRQQNKKPIIQMDSNLPPESKLFWSLFHGWEDKVTESIDEINNSESQNCYDLLTATYKKNETTSSPGFFLAFGLGHHKAINAYVQGILKSNLTESEKIQLLSPKHVDGTPGLVAALRRGDSKVVQTYIEAIFHSNMTIHDKLYLITPIRSDGTPELVAAFQKGDTKVVQTYIEAILNSNLSTYEQFNLINAKHPSGTPGLILAMQNSHDDTVKTYSNTILNANINPAMKTALLQDKYLFELNCLNSLLGYDPKARDYISQCEQNKDQCKNPQDLNQLISQMEYIRKGLEHPLYRQLHEISSNTFKGLQHPFNQIPINERANIASSQHDSVQNFFKQLINLQQTVQSDSTNTEKITPLHIATLKGYTETVSLLLKHNIKVYAADVYGDQAIHLAAQHGHKKIAQLLLQHGAQIDSIGKDYQTPLLYSVSCGQLAMVNFLLENQARQDITDKEGKTPLHIAARSGNIEIVKLLFQHNSANNETIANNINDIEFIVNQLDINGNSPLSLAAMNGHVEVVSLLLENNADINSIDKNDSTPLNWAAMNGHSKVVHLLLIKGAKANCMDKYGNSPLQWAANNGYTEIVEILIDFGANLDSITWNPNALHSIIKVTLGVDTLSISQDEAITLIKAYDNLQSAMYNNLGFDNISQSRREAVNKILERSKILFQKNQSDAGKIIQTLDVTNAMVTEGTKRLGLNNESVQQAMQLDYFGDSLNNFLDLYPTQELLKSRQSLPSKNIQTFKHKLHNQTQEDSEINKSNDRNNSTP